MTEIGEGVHGGQTGDSDSPRVHSIEIEYTYTNGQPVVGNFTATDSEGVLWSGVLDDEGYAKLTGLPEGTVELELIPEDVDAELASLRKSIKTLLDEIIEAEKAEAAKVDESYDYGLGTVAAVANGLWDGAVGLVSFAWDTVKTVAEVAYYLSPVEQLNNLLSAAYESYKAGDLTTEQWLDSLVDNWQDEQFDDLARLLGFDLRSLTPERIEEIKRLMTEAYEVAAFILDDDETRDIVTEFAKQYATVQSSYEWLEIAGGAVFELVLTALLLAFTGGIGNVAQVGSKIRHATKLRTLGHFFRKIGKKLRRKKLKKSSKINTDSKKTYKAEQPNKPDLAAKVGKRLDADDLPCFNKKLKDPDGKLNKEFDRQLQDQQDALNEMTVDDVWDRRQEIKRLKELGLKPKRKSTAPAREKFQKFLEDQYVAGGDMTRVEAMAKAAEEMKTLAALHNPDMVGGGKDTISGFGDRKVNNSIGGGWSSKTEKLDDVLDKARKAGKGDHKLNLKLKRCK